MKMARIKELLYEAIRDVTISEKEERQYFRAIYKLYVGDSNRPLTTGTAWKHLPFHARVAFFGRWFTAVSPEYIRACKKYQSIKDKYESDKFFVISLLALKLPVRRHDRYEMLVTSPSAVTGEEMEGNPFNDPTDLWASFRPVWQPSLAEISETENRRSIVSREFAGMVPEYGALKFVYISVKYPVDYILQILKPILEQTQKDYYAAFPEAEHYFVKKDCRSRKVKYPFEEWERYLMAYILKHRGDSFEILRRRFYEFNVDGERQAKRDVAHGEKLCRNAALSQFPGKY